jgi:hypothetical protein
MAATLVDLNNRNNFVPPLAQYEGETSFFGGNPPLPRGALLVTAFEIIN